MHTGRMSGIGDAAHRLFMNDCRSLAIYAIAVVLVSLAPVAPTLAAAPHDTPRETAERIEALTAGGPYDPMTVAVFAHVDADRLDAQRAARLR
ncbi:MAG TPA: hypothetical protein VNF99_00685 [Stellaceae bacterium]|nr:hypothetical protein [Stellaceae bacterium]